MLEKYKISELFDLNQTMAAELLRQYEYPWEVLPHIGSFILELGAKLSLDEYDKAGEDIWVHKTATIAPTANAMTHISAVGGQRKPTVK